jgi:Uma2 family endonuclease
MSVMASATRHGEAFTREDLEDTPDDGHRYEVVDGTLIVTAAPGLVHQDATLELTVLLRGACPLEMKVVIGPYAVALSADTEVQPDIVVGRRSEFSEREITRPLLVVEVLSYSTRLYDTHVKWERFERARIPSYWMVHPSARPAEAALTVWELDEKGRYREVAKATGEERFEATIPFPVTVIPADLVR